MTLGARPSVGPGLRKLRRLPYDPADPPADPPRDADPVLWVVAYALHVEHRPGVDGFCIAGTCRARFSVWPCHASELARAGLCQSVVHLLAETQMSRRFTEVEA